MNKIEKQYKMFKITEDHKKQFHNFETEFFTLEKSKEELNVLTIQQNEIKKETIKEEVYYA